MVGQEILTVDQEILTVDQELLMAAQAFLLVAEAILIVGEENPPFRWEFPMAAEVSLAVAAEAHHEAIPLQFESMHRAFPQVPSQPESIDPVFGRQHDLTPRLPMECP
jgi:hypothetical protein